jgi:hypothetical protein
MALIIRHKKVEVLARILADRTGLNMTDAVEDALRARLAGGFSRAGVCQAPGDSRYLCGHAGSGHKAGG